MELAPALDLLTSVAWKVAVLALFCSASVAICALTAYFLLDKRHGVEP